MNTTDTTTSTNSSPRDRVTGTPFTRGLGVVILAGMTLLLAQGFAAPQTATRKEERLGEELLPPELGQVRRGLSHASLRASPEARRSARPADR